MLIDDLGRIGLFEGLTRDQLADLVTGSTEVRVEPGMDLFREVSSRTTGGCSLTGR
jgi:hypothetical protein